MSLVNGCRVVMLALAIGFVTPLVCFAQSPNAESTANETSGEPQPVGAEARELLDSGYFREALAASERAFRELETEAELTALLETRAYAFLALGDHDGLDETLRALLTIDPAYAPPGFASPDFIEHVDRVRAATTAALGLSLTTTRAGDEVELRAAMTPSLRALPMEVGVQTASAAGDASDAWTLRSSPARVPSAVPVQARPVLVSPNGSVLRTGEPEVIEILVPEPSRNVVPPAETTPVTSVTSVNMLPDPSSSTRRRRIAFAVVGVVLVAGAAVTAGVLLSRGSSDNQYVPVIEW